MNTHPAEDQARSLWREQDVPALQPLPPDELAEQAAKLQRTVSRRNRREEMAAIVITPVFLFYAWFFPHGLTKLGALLTVVGLAVMVWQLRRRASVRTLGEALADSPLAVHRSELVRQRDALRSVWLWYVAPLVPGLALFLCGRQLEIGRWEPWAFIVAGLVMAGVVALNLYAARRLQRDIDALDQLKDETP